jgi:hypothetical protein
MAMATSEALLVARSELRTRTALASGKVHGRCFKRHTHVEFIAFLESLAKRYTGRELHLICDNYGIHNPAVGQWLAAHPPIRASSCTSLRPVRRGSWLNLVERWFGLITAQAIRRGNFDSVRRLEQAITRHLAQCNETAKPLPLDHVRRENQTQHP